jgi:hypothetical protein
MMTDLQIMNALVTLVREGDTIVIEITSPENRANKVRLTCDDHGNWVKCEARRTDWGSHMDAFEVISEFMDRG